MRVKAAIVGGVLTVFLVGALVGGLVAPRFGNANSAGAFPQNGSAAVNSGNSANPNSNCGQYDAYSNSENSAANAPATANNGCYSPNENNGTYYSTPANAPQTSVYYSAYDQTPNGNYSYGSRAVATRRVAYERPEYSRTTVTYRRYHHHRSLKHQVLLVAGTSAAGAGIGALAGGGKGAGIGAIAGGVGGLIYNAFTRH
jgi:hypothetical protein